MKQAAVQWLLIVALVSVECDGVAAAQKAHRAVNGGGQSLLARAVKARPSVPHFSWFSWLTDREVLVGYGDKSRDFDFYRIDRFTGRKRPAREMNRTFLIWNHMSLDVSPDGRFAVWREAGREDDPYVVVSLDGSGFVHRWQGGGLHNPILWLADSRHWCVLGDEFAEYYSYAEVYDLKAPTWSQHLRLPPKAVTWSAASTLRGTLLSHSWDGSEPLVHKITVMECRLLPHPRLLHRFRFAIPVKGDLCSISFSPSGKRIAWNFSKPGNGPEMKWREVWICDIRGRSWQKVGEMEMTASDEQNLGFDVNWLPSGSALSFTWQGALWTIRV